MAKTKALISTFVFANIQKAGFLMTQLILGYAHSKFLYFHITYRKLSDSGRKAVSTFAGWEYEICRLPSRIYWVG